MYVKCSEDSEQMKRSDSIWLALQIFEQFCPKAGDVNPFVAESETDFNAKWPFKVIQGHLFRYH